MIVTNAVSRLMTLTVVFITLPAILQNAAAKDAVDLEEYLMPEKTEFVYDMNSDGEEILIQEDTYAVVNGMEVLSDETNNDDEDGDGMMDDPTMMRHDIDNGNDDDDDDNNDDDDANDIEHDEQDLEAELNRIETNHEDEDEKVSSQQDSCTCSDKINTDLLSSLKSCTKTLTETGKDPGKCPAKANVELEVSIQSCTCAKKETKDLDKALKSCSKVVDKIINCKATIESCNDLKNEYPKSESGYYNIYINEAKRTVYCNMETMCGVEGGWTKIAHMDMTDDKANSCPEGFKEYEGDVRSCGMKNSMIDGCISAKFPTKGVAYSKVCGKVKVAGYQYESDETSYNIESTSSSNDVAKQRMKGVSITRGYPPKHIWSFKAKDAGEVLVPWFKTNIGLTTTDFLELNLCSKDERGSTTNLPISQYELYIN